LKREEGVRGGNQKKKRKSTRKNRGHSRKKKENKQKKKKKSNIEEGQRYQRGRGLPEKGLRTWGGEA